MRACNELARSANLLIRPNQPCWGSSWKNRKRLTWQLVELRRWRPWWRTLKGRCWCSSGGRRPAAPRAEEDLLLLGRTCCSSGGRRPAAPRAGVDGEGRRGSRGDGEGRRGARWGTKLGKKSARGEIWFGRGSKRGPAGKKARQAPPDSIGGVQFARTPRMRSYPRRTAMLYASDTDRWSRPLNRVRAPHVSIRGVHKACTPRLCLHPGRTGITYATDADSRVPPSLAYFIVLWD
jgi:hypothetical protein